VDSKKVKKVFSVSSIYEVDEEQMMSVINVSVFYYFFI